HLVRRDYALLQDLVQGFSKDPAVQSLWVADERGLVLAHSEPDFFGEPLGPVIQRPPFSENKVLIREDLRRNLLHVEFPMVLAGNRWGTVGMEYSTASLQETLGVLGGEALLVTGIFVLVGFWLGAVFSKRITAPVSELTRAANALEAGDFNIEVQVEAENEVGALQHHFTRMARALAESQRELQEKNEALNTLNQDLARRVREATAELSRTMEYLSFILKSARDAIITTDRAGSVQTLNRAAEELFEVRSDEVAGKPVDELLGKGKEISEALAQVVGKEQTCEVENRIQDRKGEYRILSLTISPLKSDAGELLGTVVIASDLTEKKRYQEELLRSEKLASVGELAAGVAHEINNIIMVILGFADLLLRQTSPDHSSTQDLKVIEREAKRGRDIVQRLLRFARPQPLKLARTELESILGNTISLLSHQIRKGGIQVKTDYDPGVSSIVCDRGQLEMVFTNIALNAVQVLGEGGILKIKTRAKGAGRVEVVISDNGPGIRPEHMGKIFDPFFTTKEPGQGTGLGLSVAYRIVHEHGGTIRAQSRPGEGTSFLIELPIGSEREEAHALPPSGDSGEKR
ncbi:MAG TPA: ATP-binding protein, partial [bacterium]|nr:ATP-binding protein [bacterium]